MSEGVLPHDAAGPSGAAPDARSGGEPLPAAVVDAAVVWAVRLDYNQPSAQDRQAFQHWFHADPLHALAWTRVHSMKSLRDALGGMPARLALDALQKAQAKRARRGRRAAVKLLSLAGVALAAGWTMRTQAPWQRLFADASTGVGERSTLQLADGTVVVLGTDSAVSIDLAGAQRIVVLRRGEILVTTGADAAAPVRRPFWVHTPFGRLRAIGTRFVVRLDEARGRVSVQEGAVELHPADGGAPAVAQAGESRWLAEHGSAPAEPQGFAPDGWADGVIAARGMRLDALLAELARYRHGVVVCDPRVAGLRVSGLFQLEDTDRTLEFIAQSQPVRVDYRTRFWVAVGPRETS